MSLPDGASQVFSEVTRFSVLDVNGFPAAGSNTFSTDQLLKATFTPVLETGVDLANVNAAGDLVQMYKHGDMPKYYTMQVEVASPDPVLHQILAGGVVLTDSSSALSTPGTITATPSATGGTLINGPYYYTVAACNQYGETLPSAEVTGTVTGASGPAGSVGLSVAAVTGATYYRWYGRGASGTEQLIIQTTGPTWTDTGALTPGGAQPTVNTTAGPGTDTGWQAAPLGQVTNPNGIGIEFWGAAVIEGAQTAQLPYYRWVCPRARYLHEDARTFDPAFLANVYIGQCFRNPNWGSGPFGDWQFDSSQVFQYARAADTTLPVPGLAPVPATA